MNIKVSSELFVKIWGQAKRSNHNMKWVADQLSKELGVDISPQLVSQRAKYMRAQGVKLPELKEAYQRVDKLNQMLEGKGMTSSTGTAADQRPTPQTSSSQTAAQN